MRVYLEFYCWCNLASQILSSLDTIILWIRVYLLYQELDLRRKTGPAQTHEPNKRRGTGWNLTAVFLAPFFSPACKPQLGRQVTRANKSISERVWSLSPEGDVVYSQATY